MATKKTKTKEPESVEQVVDPRIAKYEQLIELTDAFTKEIDNIFMARLKPGQIGSVLGNVVKQFKLRQDLIKSS